MTLEQLAIFIAVAEREHLTRAAEALRLTPSAVSASIKTLEAYYNVALFDRVGRGIQLTQTGKVFLGEARATLARARSAEMVLNDLGGLKRGALAIHASQTIANYWLPARLLRFHERHPAIDINLVIGNTMTVTQAVIEGAAELGFIEGAIDEPALALETVARDELVIVARADHSLARSTDLPKLVAETFWVMREPGSGTRSEFEAALTNLKCDPAILKVAMAFPSNEAVLSAVRASQCVTALSQALVTPLLASGELTILPIALPSRAFTALRHKERRMGLAAKEFMAICAAG